MMVANISQVLEYARLLVLQSLRDSYLRSSYRSLTCLHRPPGLRRSSHRSRPSSPADIPEPYRPILQGIPHFRASELACRRRDEDELLLLECGGHTLAVQIVRYVSGGLRLLPRRAVLDVWRGCIECSGGNTYDRGL